MPSKNPATGRPLDGASIRRRRAARQLVLAASSPSDLAATPAPPVGEGVAAIELWASSLLMAATAANAPQLEPLAAIMRELGRLRAKAARSEKACRLAQLRLGWQPVDFAAPAPPTDRPVAAVAWAFAQLAQLAHLVATKPALLAVAPLGWLSARVKALVSIGFLPGNDEIKRVIEEARGA